MIEPTKLYVLTSTDYGDITYIHLPKEWAEWFLLTKADPTCVPESLNKAYDNFYDGKFPYSESRYQTLINMRDAAEEYHISGGIQGIIDWYEDETRTMNVAPQIIEIEA